MTDVLHEDFQDHVDTYRGFVHGVRLVILAALAGLSLMAYFLL